MGSPPSSPAPPMQISPYGGGEEEAEPAACRDDDDDNDVANVYSVDVPHKDSRHRDSSERYGKHSKHAYCNMNSPPGRRTLSSMESLVTRSPASASCPSVWHGPQSPQYTHHTNRRSAQATMPARRWIVGRRRRRRERRRDFHFVNEISPSERKFPAGKGELGGGEGGRQLHPSSSDSVGCLSDRHGNESGPHCHFKTIK